MSGVRNSRERLAGLGATTIKVDRYFDMTRVQLFPNEESIKASCEKWRRECADVNLDTHSGCLRVFRR